MSTPIVVKFTLSPREYASAIRESMMKSKVILLVLALLLYMGISPTVTYLLKHSENPSVAFPSTGLLYMLGCLGMITYLVWAAPILAVRKLLSATRDREQEFRFDEEGSEVMNAVSPGRFDWKTWVRFRESGRFFFLYPTSRVLHIVPKRAFSSDAERAAFRNLLKLKLKRA